MITLFCGVAHNIYIIVVIAITICSELLKVVPYNLQSCMWLKGLQLWY